MTTSFSLSQLFEQAFGYKTDAFKPEFNKLPDRIYTSSNGTPFYDYDTLGREYFLPAVISYTLDVATGVGADSFGQVKKYTLPYPVISVMAKKNIVDTTLTQRKGTVKEIISMLDYDITIRGLIINNNNQYPESDIAALTEIFEQNQPVQLQNALTDILLLHPDRKGSDNVVIKELSFPETRGAKNIKSYQLSLVSDAIFNLEDIG